MKLAQVSSLLGLKGTTKVAELLQSFEEHSTFRIVGWTSLAVGIAALGLYFGHEARSRYKFRHRTPYDFFSHAGDESAAANYGMGI